MKTLPLKLFVLFVSFAALVHLVRAQTYDYSPAPASIPSVPSQSSQPVSSPDMNAVNATNATDNSTDNGSISTDPSSISNPGLPSTGASGQAPINIMLLVTSALFAATGILLILV